MPITSLIVGSHFRPPAKQLLAAAAAGTALTLQPEAENPYDEWAIKVFLDPAAIPANLHEELSGTLEGTGMDLDEVLNNGSIFIGYVAKTGGKPLAGTGYVGNQDFYETLTGTEPGELPASVTDLVMDWDDVPSCRLGFSPEGKPTITMEV